MCDDNFKTLRLTRESARLQKKYAKCGDIAAHLQSERWCAEMSDSVTHWTAKLYGAEGTPYENQEYDLLLDFSGVDYPAKPPKVCFIRKIPYHANVYQDGSICVDILGSEWSPAYSISDLLASLVSMLNEPNTESPANSDAAKAYDEDDSERKTKFAKLAEKHYNKQQ